MSIQWGIVRNVDAKAGGRRPARLAYLCVTLACLAVALMLHNTYSVLRGRRFMNFSFWVILSGFSTGSYWKIVTIFFYYC